MGTRNTKKDKELGVLDELIAEITVDAYGDDEQLWAFRQAFEDDVALPADGFVIGEPVSLIAVDYDGNERRGLTANCRREDGSEYVVAVSDVVLPQTSSGARYIAAYRRWLKLDPYPARNPETFPSRAAAQGHRRRPRFKQASRAGCASGARKRAARCRLLGSDRIITLRASRLWEVVPGAIVTVTTRKQWRYGGHPYLSGEIQSTRIEVKALDLAPLGLAEMGMWDPKEEYWGEEGEPIEEWAEPIIAHGPPPHVRDGTGCCPVKPLAIPSMIPSPDQTISKMPASGQRRKRS